MLGLVWRCKFTRKLFSFNLPSIHDLFTMDPWASYVIVSYCLQFVEVKVKGEDRRRVSSSDSDYHLTAALLYKQGRNN